LQFNFNHQHLNNVALENKIINKAAFWSYHREIRCNYTRKDSMVMLHRKAKPLCLKEEAIAFSFRLQPGGISMK